MKTCIKFIFFDLYIKIRNLINYLFLLVIALSIETIKTISSLTDKKTKLTSLSIF